MLVAEYSEGRWQEPRIMPFEPLPVPQSMAALHYGQSIFEGLKVYRRRRHPALLPPARQPERFLRSAELSPRK